MRHVTLFLLLAGCGANSVTFPMTQQNNSGQDGFATLTQKGDEVQVFVSIRRSNIDGSQTSHIHEGRCDNVGRIAAGVGSVKPDSNMLFISDKADPASLDGGSVFFQAQIKVPLEKLRDGNHVINVHDARENSLYVSCGEIN